MKKKKKDKGPPVHLSSWEQVSGNQSPSELMYFSKDRKSRYDFFRLVDDSKLAQLYSFFEMERVSKNKVLYRQNDLATDMRILLHGAVKLTNENVKGISKERIVNQPGGHISVNVLGGRKFRESTATTTEPSTFLILTTNAYERLVQVMPDVASDIEQALGDRKRSTFEEIEWLEPFTDRLLSVVSIKMVAKGENIFEQAPSMTSDSGDGKGGRTVSGMAASWSELNTMYIVSDGKVRLRSTQAGGWEMTLKRTDIFGIHGFLFGTPRLATATAMKPTVLLKFEMANCRKLIESLAPLQRALDDRAKELSLRYLRPSRLLRSVNDSSFKMLATLFHIESHRAGSTILDATSSSQKNKTFSVLAAGTALELHDDLKRPGDSVDHQNNQHEKLRGLGSWFNHESLLGTGKPSFSVKASSPCVTLTLRREQFTSFLQLLPSRKMFEEGQDDDDEEDVSTKTSSHFENKKKRVSVDDLISSPHSVPSPARLNTEDHKRASRRLSIRDSVVKAIQDKTSQEEYMWEYKDPEGNTHGPFTLNQMRTWYQLNFFLPEVPMRIMESSPDGEGKEEKKDKFRPMSEIYPGGAALAFTYLPAEVLK
jgi:CRP-like cAMP-binding protein